jgi:RNA polymerase sigma factor (TIGR02999 family)
LVSTVTELIQRAGDGDGEAADSLFALMYGELRRLARSRLRATNRHTLLDTGSLVHEAYLRFADTRRLQLEDRLHFMRWAAKVMRSVIVDFARRRAAARRGGAAPRVTFHPELAATCSGEDEILGVHEALNQIAEIDPRMGRIVEMRYFCGMTEPQIAQALGITERTVRRDWQKARLLLREALT